MEEARILIVEDDPNVAGMVTSALEEERYRVSVATSVMQGRRMVEKEAPDLLILDRNLPDRDGLTLCSELRARPETAALPILFLTARKSVTDKVLGLRMGGDDYLSKPFSIEELIARVASLLRRNIRPKPPGNIRCGKLELEVPNRLARLGGKELDLTRREFDFLQAVVERPDRVLTRSFLLARVWGIGAEERMSPKSVDMVLLSLRKKMGKWAKRIEAVKGFGYRLRSKPR
ncbi:response regulator transcription factor [Elusimicrobiota bacterium]